MPNQTEQNSPANELGGSIRYGPAGEVFFMVIFAKSSSAKKTTCSENHRFFALLHRKLWMAKYLSKGAVSKYKKGAVLRALNLLPTFCQTQSVFFGQTRRPNARLHSRDSISHPARLPG